MRKNLTKSEILRKKDDIRKVFIQGSECKVPGLKIKFIKNDFAFTRVLITFIRKYGTSVARNRAKRILKEIYRQIKSNVKQGMDIVFIILPGTFSYQERLKQIEEILFKTSLLLHTPYPI